MHNEFTAVFERDGDWFVAYCPETEIPNLHGINRLTTCGSPAAAARLQFYSPCGAVGCSRQLAGAHTIAITPLRRRWRPNAQPPCRRSPVDGLRECVPVLEYFRPPQWAKGS